MKPSRYFKRISAPLSTLRITSAELEKQTKPKRVKPKKTGASELGHRVRQITTETSELGQHQNGKERTPARYLAIKTYGVTPGANSRLNAAATAGMGRGIGGKN